MHHCSRRPSGGAKEKKMLPARFRPPSAASPLHPPPTLQHDVHKLRPKMRTLLVTSQTQKTIPPCRRSNQWARHSVNGSLRIPPLVTLHVPWPRGPSTLDMPQSSSATLQWRRQPQPPLQLPLWTRGGGGTRRGRQACASRLPVALPSSTRARRLVDAADARQVALERFVQRRQHWAANGGGHTSSGRASYGHMHTSVGGNL